VRRPRALPSRSLETLYPPVPGYRFFDGAGDLPFAPTAGLRAPGNHWWLAEHALLAYSGVPAVRDTLALRDVEAVLVDNPRSNGFAALSVAADHAVLVFRGTEVFKPGDPWSKVRSVLTDWASDAAVARVAWDGPGRVHRGFRDAFEALWPALKPALQALRCDQPLYCCGHSLGGALALLAAARLQAVRPSAPLHLLTLGQPRVGDADFKAALSDLDALRLVNGRDLVARLPPGWMGYRHVGRKRVLGDGPAAAAEGDEAASDQTSRLSRWLGRMTPAGLADHSPLHYTLRAWNAAL
jgi:hypothetical protein